MKKISIMLVVVAFALLCSACQMDSNKDNKPFSSNQAQIEEQLDELYGVWDLDNNTKYSFDGKGSGELILSSDNYAFSYLIKDGILSINFTISSAKDSKYKYSLNGDTLVLNSQDNNKGEYILKKTD